MSNKMLHNWNQVKIVQYIWLISLNLTILSLGGFSPSNEVVFICVLVVQLHLQLLPRGLMNNELHTDEEDNVHIQNRVRLPERHIRLEQLEQMTHKWLNNSPQILSCTGEHDNTTITAFTWLLLVALPHILHSISGADSLWRFCSWSVCCQLWALHKGLICLSPCPTCKYPWPPGLWPPASGLSPPPEEQTRKSGFKSTNAHVRSSPSYDK